MDKKYHFLTGFPRSGNTLLSAILNQNPEIYSSPLSPVGNFIWDFAKTCKTSKDVNRNTENQIRSKLFLYSFIDNYYKEIKTPVVIDRSKSWCTPFNLNIIKEYITPTPKIIFTVRDILEIIASFVKMDLDYIKYSAHSSEYLIDNYRSEKDLVCEYLMDHHGDIDRGLVSIASAFYPENKGMFHIVEYNDIVLHPNETMSKIYNFLEMPDYKHNFNKIEKVEKDNDEAVGFPKDLHKIRKSLSKSSTDINILSDYIKHKYSNMEFWRKNSSMKVRGKDF